MRGRLWTTGLFIIILVSEGVKAAPQPCFYCPRAQCNPTITGVKDVNWKAATDAAALRNAIKGVGTDEDTLIKIMTTCSETQREAISEEYTTLGRNLVTDIEGDTSRSFKKLLVALATPLLTFYTKQLGEALQKSDRLVTIEILSSLPPCVIKKIGARYSDFYKGRNLYNDVQGFNLNDAFYFSNSDYNNIMKSLAQGDRDSDWSVNEAKALADAKRLKKDGVDTWGTKESTFVEIFTKRSIPQLAATLEKYEELRFQQKHKKITMEEDIESEFSGNVKEALKAISTYARDPPMYFAIELKTVLDQWFQSKREEEKVIRIIRGRCDIDLQDIKLAYQKKFQKSLYSVLEGKFNLFNSLSHYKQTLLAVVKP